MDNRFRLSHTIYLISIKVEFELISGTFFFLIIMAESVIEKISSRLNLSEEAMDKLSVMVEKYKSLNEMGTNEFVSLMGDNLKDRIGKYVAMIREESLLNRLIFHSRLPLFIAVVFLIFVFGMENVIDLIIVLIINNYTSSFSCTL